MNRGDNQDLERELRERIIHLMRTIGKARCRQITGEEFQRLMGAATRLDELLKSAGDAERQELKSAAGRLDQLLADIRTGKDVMQGLKGRRDAQDGSGSR